MLNLQAKLKKKGSVSGSGIGSSGSGERPISIRDQLLRKELPELESVGLNSEIKLHWDDPNQLHQFTLLVRPINGIWKGGRFRFRVLVPDDYNNAPPTITCLTKVWHPNISEDGQVCLSLLRQNAIDYTGWTPARTLKDVVWGVLSLFHELADFHDPLNAAAADQYHQNRDAFERKVVEYIRAHAR